MKFEDIVGKDFSYCISIVKNGEVIFQKSYGYSDLSNKVCNKIDTRFSSDLIPFFIDK